MKNMLSFTIGLFLLACEKEPDAPEKENNPPQIQTVAPKEGKKGDDITISGQHLSNILSVKFNGVDAFFRITGGNVVAKVPEGAASGFVSITTNVGTASSKDSFKVVVNNIPAPFISDVYPSSNPTDWPLIIEGENLGAIVSIKFKGVEAEVDSSAPGYVTTRVPQGVQPGPGILSLTTEGGTINYSYRILDKKPIAPPPPKKAFRREKARYFPKLNDNWTNESDRPGSSHSLQLTDDGGFEFLEIDGTIYNGNITLLENNIQNKTIKLAVERDDGSKDIYTGEYVDSDVPNQDNPTRQRIIFYNSDRRQFVVAVNL